LLFDPRPKCSRRELFDRGRELEELERALEDNYPVVLLTGIRRIGKTSLLCVFLNEAKLPYILLDARGLPPNYGVKDLYTLISQAMSKPSLTAKLRKILEMIKGVKVVGVEVELSWRGSSAVPLPVLFDYLNRERVIVAVDEAQKLRGPRGGIFLEALAHAYDYDRNLSFILTGSEVGLLYNYLGVNNPSSPMYGRYLYIIEVQRFSRQDSIEFLKRGLEEVGLQAQLDYIESIVDFFDGIPGWLTLAGSLIARRRKLLEIQMLREQAVRIALAELRKAVEVHGPRFGRVLKLIAKGYNTWRELKTRLEEIEGRTVSKSSLSRILNTLEQLSIIKEYKFLDPVYREAAKMI